MIALHTADLGSILNTVHASQNSLKSDPWAERRGKLNTVEYGINPLKEKKIEVYWSNAGGRAHG